MANNSEEEGKVNLLRDMNSNDLREGDLVLVLLEKPILVGFITQIDEPSVLTKEKRPGVITVTGTVKLPFVPRQLQYMQQVVKLVDPRANALVNALSAQINKEQASAAKKESGPTLVPKSEATPVADATDAPAAPNDPQPIAD
jgi:hypothetical protein